jgi:CheY-like chemotaxis protein
MSGEKILVVEDENIVALGIKKMLKGMGFRVPSIAASGEEAIQKAEITFPDLVLMDIMLKGKIDGIKAAETIYGAMDIPVVYLTAYSDDKILERSKKTNPYGYLTKPFEEKTLQNTIKVALDNYRKEKEKKE